MKTSKYIVDEEKKKGNTKLKRYNGCLNGNILIYLLICLSFYLFILFIY